MICVNSRKICVNSRTICVNSRERCNEMCELTKKTMSHHLSHQNAYRQNLEDGLREFTQI